MGERRPPGKQGGEGEAGQRLGMAAEETASMSASSNVQAWVSDARQANRVAKVKPDSGWGWRRKKPASMS